MKRLIQRLGLTLVVTALTAVGAAQAQQVWRVGTSPNALPFARQDAATGAWEGAMVEIIQEIASDAGAQIEFIPSVTADWVNDLTSNKVDIISAAMQASAARREIINFSDPIFLYGPGLYVHVSDNNEYRTIEDLRGQIVASITGANTAATLQNSGLFAEVRTFATQEEMFQAVNDGAAKAAIINQVSATYRLQQGGYPNVKQITTFSYGPTANGIGVRKSDTELLATLNAGLARLRTNGRLVAIATKWGLQDLIVN